MHCLPGSTEAHWVQSQNEELQYWNCKQPWLCLCHRNLPTGPKSAYAYCPEMFLQVKWYVTKAKIWKDAKASNLCGVLPVQLPCTWRPSLQPPVETPARHLGLEWTCLLLPSRLVFFLLQGKEQAWRNNCKPRNHFAVSSSRTQKNSNSVQQRYEVWKDTIGVNTKTLFSISLPCRGCLVDNHTTTNSPKPKCSA